MTTATARTGARPASPVGGRDGWARERARSAAPANESGDAADRRQWMAKISKRRKAIEADVDAAKRYGLDEAAALVKKCAKAKFDETVEVAVRLGVNPKHADQM